MVFKKEAAALLDEAERAGDPVFGDFAGSRAMRVDLLRRSGDFSGACAAVESGIDGDDSEIIRTIMLYQKHLIEHKDGAAHSVSEAVEFVEKTMKQ